MASGQVSDQCQIVLGANLARGGRWFYSIIIMMITIIIIILHHGADDYNHIGKRL